MYYSIISCFFLVLCCVRVWSHVISCFLLSSHIFACLLRYVAFFACIPLYCSVLTIYPVFPGVVLGSIRLCVLISCSVFSHLLICLHVILYYTVFCLLMCIVRRPCSPVFSCFLISSPLFSCEFMCSLCSPVFFCVSHVRFQR